MAWREEWAPCRVWTYMQSNSLVTIKDIITYFPDDVYIENGPAWLDILKDYKKRPSRKDIDSIFYTHNPNKRGYLFCQELTESKKV